MGGPMVQVSLSRYTTTPIGFFFFGILIFTFKKTAIQRKRFPSAAGIFLFCLRSRDRKLWLREWEKRRERTLWPLLLLLLCVYIFPAYFLVERAKIQLFVCCCEIGSWQAREEGSSACWYSAAGVEERESWVFFCFLNWNYAKLAGNETRAWASSPLAHPDTHFHSHFLFLLFLFLQLKWFEKPIITIRFSRECWRHLRRSWGGGTTK